MEFNENGNRRVYSFDLDGVLTNGEYFWKQEPTPCQDNIRILRELYKAGNIIIIWTARQWELAPETVGWLIKNRIPFHGLYMAKGGSDNYIDDKNIDLRELRLESMFLNEEKPSISVKCDHKWTYSIYSTKSKDKIIQNRQCLQCNTNQNRRANFYSGVIFGTSDWLDVKKENNDSTYRHKTTS